MAKIFRIIILLLSLTLIQCSSDDDNTTDSSLMVNGAEFKLGTNTINTTYNGIRSKSESIIWLDIVEKDAPGEPRIISVYAMHEPGTGSATGTYTLSNNMIMSGVAVPALSVGDWQIAGGSNDSPPTGTISINDLGGNHYVVTFNNVVLDPGTETETTITGSCNKTFKL